MLLTPRQEEIAEIVKKFQPITGEEIAKKLSLTRSALRTDFSVLTSKGILKSKTRVGYQYEGKSEKKYIKEIMGEVVSVDSNISVYDTILKMFLKDVGTIFITENKSLTGIVSRKDLLKIAIGNTDITKVPISIIMTRMPNIIYCEEHEEIIVGVRKIINHQIDSLPVVKVTEHKNKKSYKLVGRVTKTNITKLFLEYFDK
ncbi:MULTISPECIES: CBS domain-containing protein [Fusobacterium]|jgi:CBS domain-containing protein|uniref:CBS domain-containing protein n=1 Tax=Fusobacterium hominis TaxID=2764326 RepID=A0A7G9GXU3_9FUSO|nr:MULTISPECIES: CBS domain-containing protein [Fusobacterium]QNM15625.1 CBS domain-containing protein [Fusobacterium hominis]